MSKDTERRDRITVINARIDALNERLKIIPGEIETAENRRREIRAQILETTKHLQEAQDIKGSAEAVKEANIELRGISKNVEDKLREQAKILVEIKELEKERAKLLAGV